MNKTIKINPSLFVNTKSTKTQKKREKIPNVKNLISPNNLKNKLLERIKEHKQKEIDKENDIKKTSNNDDLNIEKYTNEFNNSLEYLTNLSKKNKIKKKEKERNEEIKCNLNKTLKNPTIVTSPQLLNVNLELPDELCEELKIDNTTPPFHLNNYKVDNVIPYGCLKRGIKPCFKDYKKNITQKKYLSNNNNNLIIVENNEIFLNNKNIDRENKLNILKEKIKKKSLLLEKYNNKVNNETNTIVDNIDTNKIDVNVNINKDIIEDINLDIIGDINNEISGIKNVSEKNVIIEEMNKDVKDVKDVIEINNEPEKKTKKYIKKTIKKRRTLGKSKIYKKIGVLLKDNNTRKNIINAQKELKNVSLNDVKKYLYKNGFLKLGSIAPPDIIRKMYESAMLSGEITNTNKDVLLHNFIKENN